jgi:hypothetical protein
VSDEPKAATVDDRRRVVLPESCPPHSAVTIQQLDPDTWLVKRHRANKGYKVVLIPAIKKLSDDPDWEAVERKIADHTSRKVPPFEE